MRIPLDSLTLDPELQPRAVIDKALMEEYGQHLVDGGEFPPVVAFNDGKVCWLADGFHRWHTHKALGYDDIEAKVSKGTREDALRYSLSANAEHGARRCNGDYVRGYKIACKNNLLRPDDVDAVQAVLRCSGRWAEKLTEAAREKARASQLAMIHSARAEGKSQRQIAAETGVPKTTVQEVLAGGRIPHSAESDHPPEKPDWVKKLDGLETPAANAWAGALAALRAVNKQASVDELFADRFFRFDHAVEEELDKAVDWINELERRFHDGREHADQSGPDHGVGEPAGTRA